MKFEIKVKKTSKGAYKINGTLVPCHPVTKDGPPAPNLKNCLFILINSVLTGKAKY